MPYMENHTLYYKKQCPFCQKVLRFMDDNKITMDTRDTLQPGNQNDLVRIGGKKQVPCLVINGKPLYESDDIIAYRPSPDPPGAHASTRRRTGGNDAQSSRARRRPAKKRPCTLGARPANSWSG